MKNKKAAGPGEIPAELIKNGTKKLQHMMKDLFNKNLNGENLPSE